MRKEAAIANAEHKEKLKKQEQAQKLKEEKEREQKAAREKEMDENKICDISDEEAAEIIKEEAERYVERFAIVSALVHFKYIHIYLFILWFKGNDKSFWMKRLWMEMHQWRLTKKNRNQLKKSMMNRRKVKLVNCYQMRAMAALWISTCGHKHWAKLR